MFIKRKKLIGLEQSKGEEMMTKFIFLGAFIIDSSLLIQLHILEPANKQQQSLTFLVETVDGEWNSWFTLKEW